MTLGNGFGVNEEHVAASFRFIVKPSSGKTRLMNNIKLRLFIPPGLGQVVESERNEYEREKKLLTKLNFDVDLFNLLFFLLASGLQSGALRMTSPCLGATRSWTGLGH